MYWSFSQKKAAPQCCDYAFQVHQYLLRNASLLKKRLIFFEYTLNNNHWIEFCMVNPWINIGKQQKRCNPDNMAELVQHVDTDYISGWLIFDPQLGFLNQNTMSNKYKEIQVILIWFLNTAMIYADCCHEEQINQLNFVMH